MTEEAFNELFKAIGKLEGTVKAALDRMERDARRIDKIECAYQGLKGSFWTLSAILGALNLIYIAMQIKGLL